MTWPETVLGQLRKYLVIQGPAPIKKYTFPRNSRGRCFFKHYCQRLLPNIDNVIRPWITQLNKKIFFSFCDRSFNDFIVYQVR